MAGFTSLVRNGMVFIFLKWLVEQQSNGLATEQPDLQCLIEYSNNLITQQASPMKNLLKITLFVLSYITALAATAHHSAAQFNLSIRDNYVEGTVKQFEALNPHTVIVLEVTDEKGTRDVEYEGHSRNNYYRSGYRPGMVNVGDNVTLNAAPMRDGSDGGYVLGVITADGSRF
jgi:hypothetical protein